MAEREKISYFERNWIFRCLAGWGRGWDVPIEGQHIGWRGADGGALGLRATLMGGLLVLVSRRGAQRTARPTHRSVFHGTGGVGQAVAAFTLVELLVVIAVIAILAALLLPVLDKAKQRAQTAACLNNMKQLQLSHSMYGDDNHDYLPPNEAIPAEDVSWVLGDAQTDVTTTNIQNGLIFRYNQQVKIYVCPANTLTIPNGNGGYVPQTRTCSVDFALGGYAPPALDAGGLAQGGGTFNGVTTLAKFNQIQASSGGVSQKIVFVDEAQNGVDDGCFGIHPKSSGNNGWWNVPGCRHDGKRACTFTFADGHVEVWRWHGTAVMADNLLSYSDLWNSDAVADPAGSSDDLPRVQAGTIP